MQMQAFDTLQSYLYLWVEVTKVQLFKVGVFHMR